MVTMQKKNNGSTHDIGSKKFVFAQNLLRYRGIIFLARIGSINIGDLNKILTWFNLAAEDVMVAQPFSECQESLVVKKNFIV